MGNGGSGNLTLTAEELIDLTGYKRPAGQFRVLLELGFRAWRRADGSIVVLRSQISQPGSSSSFPALPKRPRLRLPDGR